ncbi:MAG: chemotaxis protein CheW [Ignavibacteria bacterium]|nr:chemotaxis protein CheW [Ignavibacteria bacterium]
MQGFDNSLSEEILQLVSFNLGDEEFAIDIIKVQEIIKMIEHTYVPNTYDYVEGVINLRGKVIPIVNLRMRLGIETKEFDKNTRIIVAQSNSKTVGFIVDSVNEVLRIDKSTIEQTPQLVSSIDDEYIFGIGKINDKILILLDLAKISSHLNSKENDTKIYE